jgi:hypothetical protein
VQPSASPPAAGAILRVSARFARAARSAAAAVFLFPLSYLPFSELVPWANISISISAESLVAFSAKPRGSVNPLRALRAMVEEEPTRLRAMQLALADARWLLHYRKGGVPGWPANRTQPPSAGTALAHHLVSAAKQRLRAVRAGMDVGACGKETLGDITVYR